jgi:hypothetical protein
MIFIRLALLIIIKLLLLCCIIECGYFRIREGSVVDADFVDSSVENTIWI